VFFKEEIMKKSYKTAMSVVLVLAMVFNISVLPVAVYAQEQSANVELISAQTNTDQASSEISNVKSQLDSTGTIKTKWYMTSGTVNKISSAKTEVAGAEGDVAKANEATKSQGIAGAIDKVAETTLSGLAKVAAAAQSALIKLGQLLQNIGKMLQTVASVLKAVGQVLTAIPWTTAIGQALINVGNLLTKIGCAVQAAGAAIEAIGNGASNADQSFGDLLGTVVDATKKGWTQGDTINATTDASTAVADTTSKIKDIGSSIGGALKGIFSQDAGADM
jgi:hypothetical protein